MEFNRNHPQVEPYDDDAESLLGAIGDGVESKRPSSTTGSIRVVRDSLLQPDADDDMGESSGSSGTTVIVEDTPLTGSTYHRHVGKLQGVLPFSHGSNFKAAVNTGQLA